MAKQISKIILKNKIPPNLLIVRPPLKSATEKLSGIGYFFVQAWYSLWYVKIIIS